MKNHLLVLLIAMLVGVGVTTGASASSQGMCRLHTIAAGRYFTGTLGRSSRTSCPFANNVFQAAVNQIVRRRGNGGDFRVFAWSPVTQKWYRMRCYGYGNIYGNKATEDCFGGIGARVDFDAWIR